MTHEAETNEGSRHVHPPPTQAPPQLAPSHEAEDRGVPAVGIRVRGGLAGEPSIETQDRFIDQLLSDLVEPRGLSLGGGVNCGFVAKRKGSPSEEDRQAFDAWLRRWRGVQAVEVGHLRDAWYDEPQKGKSHG